MLLGEVAPRNKSEGVPGKLAPTPLPETILLITFMKTPAAVEVVVSRTPPPLPLVVRLLTTVQLMSVTCSLVPVPLLNEIAPPPVLATLLAIVQLVKIMWLLKPSAAPPVPLAVLP